MPEVLENERNTYLNGGETDRQHGTTTGGGGGGGFFGRGGGSGPGGDFHAFDPNWSEWSFAPRLSAHQFNMHKETGEQVLRGLEIMTLQERCRTQVAVLDGQVAKTETAELKAKQEWIKSDIAAEQILKLDLQLIGEEYKTREQHHVTGMAHDREAAASLERPAQHSLLFANLRTLDLKLAVKNTQNANLLTEGHHKAEITGANTLASLPPIDLGRNFFGDRPNSLNSHNSRRRSA